MKRNYPVFNLMNFTKEEIDLINLILSKRASRIVDNKPIVTPDIIKIVDLAINDTKTDAKSIPPSNRTKLEESKEEFKKLKDYLSSVIDNTITYNVQNNITNNITAVTNNFKIQVYGIQNQLSGWMLNISDFYNISVINSTECVTRIREYLNLSDDTLLPLKKIDWDNTGIDKLSSNSTISAVDVVYAIYNPLTGEQVNVTEVCTDISIGITVPIVKDTNLSQALFDRYQTKNINIYDRYDRFFTDICFSYVNSTSETDIPLSLRQTVLNPNVTIECGEGCKFLRLEREKYVYCSCVNVNKASRKVSDYFFKIITETNLEVIKCINNVIDKVKLMNNFQQILKKNIGFFMLGAIFVVTLGLVILTEIVYTMFNFINYSNICKNDVQLIDEKINNFETYIKLKSESSMNIIPSNSINNKVVYNRKI